MASKSTKQKRLLLFGFTRQYHLNNLNILCDKTNILSINFIYNSPLAHQKQPCSVRSNDLVWLVGWLFRFACLYFAIFGIIIRSLETICGLWLNNNARKQSEEQHKYFWCFMHKYVRIYNYNYCDHGDRRHDNMLDSQTTPLHFLTKEFVSEALWEMPFCLQCF